MTITVPTPSVAMLVRGRCLLLCAASLMCCLVAASSAEKVTMAPVERTDARRVNSSDHLLPRNQSLLLSAITGRGVHTSHGSVTHTKDITTEKTTGSANSSTPVPGNRKSPTWYSTAGWLPSRGIKPDRSVNLSVLPMLAFGFFFFGVCIKCYSWVRDQDRTKARGQLDFEDDDDVNYGIITAGERGYREVDIRSDSTSMYDTVTSFRSIRLPVNEHTVTSVKSLPNQPYETYRSIVMRKGDEGVYDSVHSYKAFLEKSIEFNDVDIEVELVDDYMPRPRSKSYDLVSDRAAQEAGRAKRRRLRRHSGGRSLEGNVKAQAEKERFRRHSDKSTPHPPNPESIRSKTFHRRSSPAILEPLLQGSEFKIPLEQSEEEEEEGACSHPKSVLDRQSSNSSSSTGRSSSGSRKQRESSHKQRREKLRQKRAVSQDRLGEKAAKVDGHSTGHISDDSPQSSCSSKGSSSNELDSESDVTDSGLVMDLQKPAKQSCFKNGHSRETSRSVSPGDPEDSVKNNGRKVHRFKVTFVDDATLSATSEWSWAECFGRSWGRGGDTLVLRWSLEDHSYTQRLLTYSLSIYRNDDV